MAQIMILISDVSSFCDFVVESMTFSFHSSFSWVQLTMLRLGKEQAYKQITLQSGSLCSHIVCTEHLPCFKDEAMLKTALKWINSISFHLISLVNQVYIKIQVNILKVRANIE